MENSQLFGLMQVFISVAESQSFSESARRLGLSQPSISRQINALEEQLEVRLLQRSTRRISLTEAGQIYYEKARQIQRDVIDAARSINGFKETPSGVLKISAPYAWTDTIITPYLSRFLEKFPDISMDIECNDNFQDMIEDQLDIAIRVGILKDSSYIAVPLGDVRMVLCATPFYLEKYGAPNKPADLPNHNFILFENFDQLMFTNDVGSQLITLSGSIRTNAVTVMQTATLQHLGITLLPDLLVNPFLQRGELVEVLPMAKISIKNLPINQIFALYSNRKHLPAKVRAFLDFYRPIFTARP